MIKTGIINIGTDGLVGGTFEYLSSLSASTALHPNTIRPTSGRFAGKAARRAVIQPVTQAIHVNWPGVTATTSHLQIAVGTILVIEGTENIDQLRAIQAVAGAALRVQCDFEP